jgi:hypothetical protein
MNLLSEAEPLRETDSPSFILLLKANFNRAGGAGGGGCAADFVPPLASVRSPKGCDSRRLGWRSRPRSRHPPAAGPARLAQGFSLEPKPPA